MMPPHLSTVIAPAAVKFDPAASLSIPLLAIAFALFAFWLWMLIHAITRPSRGVDRVVAILIIVLFPVFGALIYFLFGYLRTAPADR